MMIHYTAELFIVCSLIAIFSILFYLNLKEYYKLYRIKLLSSFEKEYIDGHSDGFRLAQELRQEDKKDDEDALEELKLNCETCGGTSHGNVSYQIGYRQAIEDSSLLIDDLKSHHLWLDSDKCKLITDKLNSLKF